MKRLLVFTAVFPYPAKSMETYLETECQFYDKFDETLVFSLGVRKKTQDQKRTLKSSNIRVYPVFFAPVWRYILNVYTAFLDKNFYKELSMLFKTKRFNVKRLIRLLVFLSRAHYEADLIRKILKKIDLDTSENISYVYRFEYHPYVAILLKEELKCKIVARAHRYDLYEERNSDQYIPLRHILLKELDRVSLISEDGKNYLKDRFPQYDGKFYVDRLGTIDYGFHECKLDKNCLQIVSCSNIIPVKRVDKIIGALALLSIPVEWTHFGDGQDFKKIREAALKLPSNIKCHFKGNVPNQYLMEAYANMPYHIFVNLSESEGVPVSIMEAMSFGIPCIATDVGGTKEIVEDSKNGILLQRDVSEEKVAEIIQRVTLMSDSEYLEMRKNARSTWNLNYNAAINYNTFINMLYEKAE